MVVGEWICSSKCDLATADLAFFHSFFMEDSLEHKVMKRSVGIGGAGSAWLMWVI